MGMDVYGLRASDRNPNGSPEAEPITAQRPILPWIEGASKPPRILAIVALRRLGNNDDVVVDGRLTPPK